MQKQIKQIAAQTAAGGTPEEKKKAAEKAQREKEKKAAEEAKRETAELFKPVQTQKVPFGVDPKTVVCQFFKNGNCEKGKKCKFSHDLSIERKGEKKSLYTDTREGEDDGEDAKKKDDFVDWDLAKLNEVVLSKHGNPKTDTDKVRLAERAFVSASISNNRFTGLQIFRRSCRGRQIRLVLDMSERWKLLQIQTLPTAWLRLENKRTTVSRQSCPRKLAIAQPHHRRFPGV